jgi:hypothetical protein
MGAAGLEGLYGGAVFISSHAVGYYIAGHTLYLGGDFSAK